MDSTTACVVARRSPCEPPLVERPIKQQMQAIRKPKMNGLKLPGEDVLKGKHLPDGAPEKSAALVADKDRYVITPQERDQVTDNRQHRQHYKGS